MFDSSGAQAQAQQSSCCYFFEKLNGCLGSKAGIILECGRFNQEIREDESGSWKFLLSSASNDGDSWSGSRHE